MTTEGTPTTDAPAPAPAARRGWRRTVSVRLRITVAVVVLAALALAGAGVAVFALQAKGLDSDVDASIDRDLARFENVAQAGTADSAKELLREALSSAVPSIAEVVVAFWDGKPRLRPEGIGHEDITADPTFIEAVNRSAADGGGVIDVDSGAGPLRIAVKPVSDASLDGAIVFAYDLNEVNAELRDTIQTYATVSGIALVVVALGAYVVAGRLLGPLRTLRDTARDISDSDLTRRITATGNDDLTDLSLTFNEMLDRLDNAFTTQRRFLDDVGHELKTPITIVSGHLELMDRHDPAEVDATTDLVLDEVDRMARLVEELITLAKARRPDFLHHEPTDLGDLTDSLLEKMRALGDRDWRLDARADGRVLADGQRITQAVLQLAVNAVQHSSPGSVIGLASELRDGDVALRVRDEGEGIALDQQERIFDRFGRGTLEGEGTGLGLAIVRAIAEAHGGGVRVASVPGEGATFTIRFPARPDAGADDTRRSPGW